MRVDHFLTRDMPQPEEKRQGSIRQVVGPSLSGFQEGFLEDIRVVDAGPGAVG